MQIFKLSNLLQLLLILLVFIAPILAFSEDSPTFKIGVIVPLTGSVSDFGIAVQNGILLAQEKDKEKFGEITFIFEDSKYDSKLAVSAFHKLRTVDKVKLIFVWGTGPSEAILPLAESYQMPMLAFTTSNLNNVGKRYSIGFCFKAEKYSKLILKHLRSKGYAHFGLIKAEFSFFNELFDGMARNLREEETLELVNSFPTNSMDFRSDILKLKTGKFDVIGAFLVGGQVSQFFIQAANLNLNKPIFGANTFDSQTQIQLAQGSMKGAFFPTVNAEEWFKDKYRSVYANDIQVSMAAYGYDFANLIASQLTNHFEANLSSEDILRILRAAPPQDGATGRFKYLAEDNSFDFPVVMESIS